jgi:hypothetical protein
VTEREALPVLIKLYDQYNNRWGGLLESYRGESVERYVGQFLPILALADNRHADLLQKFMVEHAPLSTLTNHLVEVRMRPAAVAPHEPPFRLGTNLVTVVIQP